MKDNLRELANTLRRGDCNDAECLAMANEINQILDAEGDGGVPLPGVVWNERTEAAHLIKRGTEVEFCAEYGCCRVFTHPARSGAVEAFTDKHMQKLSEYIASSTSPSDESRLEIAYAIARHLKLDGWPAAYQTARSGVVSDEDVRDAERYRWLRALPGMDAERAMCPNADGGVVMYQGDMLDKRIDDAIQGERHER